MNFRIKFLIILICTYLNVSVIFAADEQKNDTKLSDEKTTKEELIDVEISGVLFKKVNLGSKQSARALKEYYYMIKSENGIVRLENKIGNKEIDCDPYIDKEVVVKGKAKIKVINDKDGKIIKITELSSIVLNNIKLSEKSKDPKEKTKEVNK